jgi:cobalt-zinc-cadmium efflux system outer membrane protein
MNIQTDTLMGWCIIFVVLSINSVSVFAHTKTSTESQSHPLNDPLSLLSVLDTFVQNALENNPAIQATQANVLAAKARQRATAQPLYNPQFTAEVQSTIESTAGINQTIDWIDKQETRTQVGSADAQVAEVQLRALRQQLAAETLNALVTYQSNAQVVLLAKERTQLLQKFTSLTQKRYANGDVARIDVDLAQLALSEAIVQQANAETNLNQALQVLRSITGFKEAHWPQFPDTLPNIKVKNIDVEKLVKKLPTLQILNNQYLSAQARISLAEKQRYPDPTIGVQGGRGEGSEGNNWLMGVTVSIPLFVRNTYSAEVDAARADVLEVVRKRRNLVRQIHAEIESSAERYEIFYQATQSWQQASGKPLSDGIVLLERLWQAGEINTTDYLVQLKQRLDSQIAGAELKGRAWQAWVELLKVSGQSDQKLDSTFIRE